MHRAHKQLDFSFARRLVKYDAMNAADRRGNTRVDGSGFEQLASSLRRLFNGTQSTYRSSEALVHDW
ncbi:hypothetical protein ACQKP5_22510 [Pseudomonas vancouverensis]|uniref:hypothetical protein n=1 Tax=Pseudomonas vancouverensis TaxID=95300 RepID=UPI003D0577C8